jgi:Prenyltransferase and squalene oxidase repeat
MSKRSMFSLVLILVSLAGLITLAQVGAEDPAPMKKVPEPASKAEAPAAPVKSAEPASVAETPATPVTPKPLSDNVKKGLAYLVNQQHKDGGWGQGGGWRQGSEGGRIEGAKVADPSDLGDTCIAMLALIRAGNTPKDGEYAKNVAQAVDFILSRIENADKDSLYVTDVRNTQMQGKIGPYVDTFLAQLVMAELKDKMPEDRGNKRLLAAFDKTMGKIAKHQNAEGNFAQNEAWASTLSLALCSKGINRAAQNGYAVPNNVLVADQMRNESGLDRKSGIYGPAVASPASPPTLAKTDPATPKDVATRSYSFALTAPSDAGVAVYSQAGKTSGLQERVNTLKQAEKKNTETLTSPTAPKADKERATTELEQLKTAQSAQTAAVDGLIRQLDNKAFIQGFGSNGGEEFLSYMNISETLVVRGGKDWLAWDKGITESLVRVQDKDGAWSGQHCITGRTFCTGTALLTLMADRAPIPVVKKDDKPLVKTVDKKSDK